jgi:cell division protease FtsH
MYFNIFSAITVFLGLTSPCISAYAFDLGNTNHLSPKALEHIIKHLSKQIHPQTPPISPFDKGYYGYSRKHHIESLRRRLASPKDVILLPLSPEVKRVRLMIQELKPDGHEDNGEEQASESVRRLWRKEEERYEENEDDEDQNDSMDPDERRARQQSNGDPHEDEVVTSGSFEVFHKTSHSFSQVGGYDSVKEELLQSVDMISNYKLYEEFNVRTPKGLILEGPPGNGKTLLAKCLSGEVKAAFIPVSGSHFNEKYVGVGASKIREMFRIARKNKPCIIFIDEIDAVGRRRSADGEAASSERDATLNELLVGLDGFKSSKGVFLIGATNRYDLLDTALTRPGRIDKRIYLGNPDKDTRKAIINIHIQGKPYCNKTITIDNLIEMTRGMSAAQIENVLNEAMLSALRRRERIMVQSDIELAMSKIMVGWQPTEHEFTEDMLRRICIHEMGHCLLGLIASSAKMHPDVVLVKLNLFAPKTPGYTIFESPPNSNIYRREELTSHLMILLGGRIAEEVIYGQSVTTGASNDIEKATSIAVDMVQKYALTNSDPESSFYASVLSEKIKEKIDEQVHLHLVSATTDAFQYLMKCKDLLIESSEELMLKRVLYKEDIVKIIKERYPELKALFF